MGFSSINWALVAPLIGIELILMIIAVVDLSKTTTQTNGPKWMWVLISLFFSIIGPILYFTIGRKHT
ncbi:PLD nuclease N-terminal domain-containing protein [Neobacillus dielmonensis]|uniref:PLD nuclease N-terminal domain-containing protein n=1 Tax=Neobacillus dielmonensis TaxID=1347369 RepID=UPI0005A6D190|nr:PLD nuclease N-terminal domain-containing protein [Neobacillus dielmonensis]